MSQNTQGFRMTAVVLFSLATVYFAYQREWYAAIITLIASTSYLAQYFKNTGDISLYRYADWLFTTPLMLFLLLTRADVPMDLVLFIMACDALMVITGYLATKETDKNKSLTWYLFGCVLFIPILLALVMAMKYSYAASLILFVWILYPILWILNDTNSITSDLQNQLISVLDIIGKIGFGVIFYYGTEQTQLQ